MIWKETASAEDSHSELENRLWESANQLWANAALKPSEFSPIVLGLIFLRFADVRFQAVAEELHPSTSGRGAGGEGSYSRRKIGPTDYHARGVLYLPEEARFGRLLALPEGAEPGKAVNEAMRAVERENPDLADVLPKTYQILENRTLAELLKVIASIPMDKEGDTFGLIYEYFLGKFAMSEGQKGGEFYTPTAIVRLIVEILEPYHGRIYDPACGSGGMFIQSARFVEAHRANRTLTPDPSPRGRGERYTGDPTKEISVHGQERVTETSRLARLNLAVHGLSGDIRQGNTYYEDLHESVGRFDFVLANPPFNVSKVDKERLAEDPRYPFGIPRTDNANYLWIQHFYAALKSPTDCSKGSGRAASTGSGRAGFVMANSAADARASEQEIREKLIRSGHVDAIVSIGPNFFYTVTLPCTLWFFDKGKSALPPSPPTPLPVGEGSKGEGIVGARYRDTVLFLDARQIFRQLDRAHRDFTPAQVEFLANIVRLYRGAEPEFIAEPSSREKFDALFQRPSPPAPLPEGEGSGGRPAGKAHMRGGFDFSGLKEKVRELRKKGTKAEVFLWELLRNRQLDGLKFRRQHQFGPYVLDFYCHERNLAVELDGPIHQEEDQHRKDQKRDAYLKSQGVAVLRFPNEDLLQSPETVLQAIASHPKLPSTSKKSAEAQPTPPSYSGRGPEDKQTLPSTSGRGAGGEGPYTYRDIPGLCKAATRAEIEAQGWSLNPGRYVGVAPGEDLSDEDFKAKLESLNEELEVLNAEAREFEDRIAANVAEIL